jgi:hypothetical protein
MLPAVGKKRRAGISNQVEGKPCTEKDAGMAPGFAWRHLFGEPARPSPIPYFLASGAPARRRI